MFLHENSFRLMKVLLEFLIDCLLKFIKTFEVHLIIHLSSERQGSKSAC